MHIPEDLLVLLFMWLALVFVFGAYVMRIAWLLYEQHHAERVLRFRLAAARGAAAQAATFADAEANR
jgi:hypothetical protein